MKTLLPFLVVVLLTSCRFHSGTFQSNGVAIHQPSRNAGTVSGSASTVHILGIGGLSTKTLIDDAKRNIYERYPLPAGSILENISVNHSKEFYLVGMAHTITIVADVIDINPTTANQHYKGFFTSDSIYFPLSNSPYDYWGKRATAEFNIGDKVTFLFNGKSENATIIERSKFGYICSYANGKRIYLQKGQMQLLPM